MKTIDKYGAQGDVLFVRIGAIPEGLAQAKSDAGKHVVAHSETGHSHAILDRAITRWETDDPLCCYLRVEGEYADVVHHRSFDTHETVRLPRGDWMVRRQREWAPEGWQRAQD